MENHTITDPIEANLIGNGALNEADVQNRSGFAYFDDMVLCSQCWPKHRWDRQIRYEVHDTKADET